MIHYIGFHGPKRVGKDYVAAGIARVIEEYDLADYKQTVIVDRIALPLYHWAESITGYPLEHLMGLEKDNPLKNVANIPPELVGTTPRQILLDHGLWVRKTYGQDFLFNCLKARSEVKENSMHSGQDLWVMIADVRTEPEAALCKIVFEIERDGYLYEGGVTESKLTSPVVNVHMKTNIMHPTHQFKELFKTYLEPLINR